MDSHPIFAKLLVSEDIITANEDWKAMAEMASGEQSERSTKRMENKVSDGLVKGH